MLISFNTLVFDLFTRVLSKQVLNQLKLLHGLTCSPKHESLIDLVEIGLLVHLKIICASN